MITTRKMTLDDMPQVEKLLQQFCDEEVSEFGFLGDATKWTELAKLYVDSTFVALNATDDVIGVLGGTVQPAFADYVKAFHSIVWYMRPDYRGHGLKLYAEVEEWCLSQGIKRMVLTHLHNAIGDQMARIFRLLGYKPLETHYIRDLDKEDNGGKHGSMVHKNVHAAERRFTGADTTATVTG